MKATFVDRPPFAPAEPDVNFENRTVVPPPRRALAPPRSRRSNLARPLPGVR